MHHQTFRRLTALCLTVIMTLTLIPSAFAAPAQIPEPGDPGSVTEMFINEADGRKIAAARTAKSTEAKNPQTITGYVYQSFSELTEHVYAKEDLTYIKGYPDRTVRGERFLSRAETATIFFRLYDGFYPALQRQMTTTTFSDVPQDTWYINELELCYNAGLISGYADGTFRPNDPVTRAEFAVVAARFAELPYSNKQVFSDVTKDHWAYLPINAAAQAGWVVGYGDGTYRPETIISRSEAVTLINRMRNRSITVAELNALGVVNPYTDLVESYWGYADLIEATVKHAATDWHELTYNGGNMNIIIERYVDSEGNEISGPTISPGRANHAPRPFERHHYLGYITTITYVYETGTAIMTATKTVDRTSAKVGDALTYTITVGNMESASANLSNVVMTDIIPEAVSFTHGSVQMDGFSAGYSYNNESRQLTVVLGDIAPGQSKVITFTAVVNSTAYGMTFTNTAVLSADNDDDQIVSDGGVTVADGTAEGSAGAKTVSSPTAKVGDTLTYSITLRNASTATAVWKNVKVSDIIPEYLSFVSGSVEEDGRASTNYAYNANTKTLTLFADSIAPGETVTFTFQVTVQDGAQGMYIVNTAVVSGDGREDIQLPDTGVAIDAGDTVPYISKTASVTEARAGDIFSYTVTIKNGADATATWKKVVLSDVLPAGVKLVSGSVTLNGSTVAYGVAGQAIQVTVGDLRPGADAVVAFDVRVLDGAAGTTIYNVAVASGDNGEKNATDNGVTIPDPEDEEIEADPGNTFTGTKTVDKTIVNTGETVTYTVTAVNNTPDVWQSVQIYDVLDTSVLTLIDDSVYVNGIRYLSGSGKWTFTDRQLVINLGDIAAGQSVTCNFNVQFKNDAANTTYTNHATIKSTNQNSVYVKAPEVMILYGGGDGSSVTDIHYQLFAGFGFGDGTPRHEWRPVNDMQLNHMCIVGYRLMTDFYRSSLGNGTFTVPDDITDREIQYFISQGVISAAEYTDGAATQAQIYRILNFAIGANLYSTSGAAMSRASVAALICDLTGRDKNPNTNGLAIGFYSDKGGYANLIDEVSNSHDYTMDSRGKETWVSILN